MPSTELAANQLERTGALKSVAQQREERRSLRRRCMMIDDEYEIYGFNRRNVDYAYMMNFLTIFDLRHQFRPALNDTAWKVILDNKWFFQLHYDRLGMPLPETYGVYQSGGGVDFRGRPLGTADALRQLLEEIRPTSLVIKPMGGIMGKGVLILDDVRYESGGIRAVTNTGRGLTFEDIAAKLDCPPNVVFVTKNYQLDLPGYILQRKLQQHQFLSRIAPATTNTVRVVTFVDRSNDVHVQATILRVGRAGNTADNWEQGGVSIAVDRTSGVLGAGVLKPKYGGKWVDTHPDSGVLFSGLQLPYWREIIELCSRGARAAPGLRSVGWDVAITPEGPVLIEGNPDWDLLMVQVHTRGLLQPDVRAQLAEFGLSFPEGGLPPFSLSKWRLRRQDVRSSRGRTLPRRAAHLLLNPPLLYRKLSERAARLTSRS